VRDQRSNERVERGLPVGTTYSGEILEHGRLVKWQRLARFRKVVTLVRRYTEDQGFSAILDLGAADGIAVPFLLTVSETVIGLNDNAAYCRQFRSLRPRQSVLAGDGCSLPFQTASLPAVVSLEMLYILPGREARRTCLAEIHRILKPGGLFICSIPIEVGVPAALKHIGRRCAGIRAERLSPGHMLKLLFYRCVDLSPYDRGGEDRLGFNAYQFAKDMADRFVILRRIRLPLWYPLCTTLMLVGKAR
jgi:SAM-dependent methyltransferase